MPVGHQADRSVRLKGLLGDGELLSGRPVAAALRSVKDLNLGEEPVIAPTLLLSLSEVGDRVRSIQGLLHDHSGRSPSRVELYRLLDDLNDLPGLRVD
jgi:hypothetical protein